MSMKDILEDLNEEQKEAVTATEGYVAVIAGAGSGKTRALTRRFAYLVNEVGISPGNILCVTFTNKAANEMRQRIHTLTDDADTGYINTFHGFCVSVLQEDSHVIHYPKSFMVLDNGDIDDMLNIIYEERNLTSRDMTYSQARDMFEMRKCITERSYFHDLIDLSLKDLEEKYRQASEVKDILFYGYLYQERKCFGLDYNDLIILTLHIFHTDEAVHLKWQKRLEYIMVDEFQDIDPLQYELMESLCGYYENLFVVGDPDQTIYTWRGARIGYILDFERSHHDTKTIMMMKNYRSTPEILQACNSLISKNRNRIEKNLVPVLPSGKPVRYHHAKTQEKEAEFIAAEIEKLHETGVNYRDMTILYRAHYVSRQIEEILIKEEIPYRIYSGVSFFDRMEIKDAIAYLRMIARQDDLSFRRIVNQPKRNIGRRRMAYLEQLAAQSGRTLYTCLNEHLEDPLFTGTKAKQFISLIEKYRHQSDLPISKMLTGILEDSGYEKMLRTEGAQERLDDLAELKQSVLEYEMTCGEETDLQTYLSQIALYTNTDMEDHKDEVKMMSVHAAKGLEFPYVFLAGMNEGIFPSRKITSETEMEEERRLAFVAMTRAEKGLILSDAEGRNFNNTYRYPSRFILDIDRPYIQYDEELPEDLIRKTENWIRKGPGASIRRDELPFHEKDRVFHKVFGEGTIQKINFKEGSVEIRFDRFERERVLSLSALDKMEKR